MNKKILFILVIITLFITLTAVSASDDNTDINNITSDNQIESNHTIHDTTLDTKTIKNSASQEYYINNSRTGNGDGSNSNPWNNITQTVIDSMDNESTVYLSSGVYKISSLNLDKSITIIGEDTSTTILDCSLADNYEIISTTSTVILSNISFINSNRTVISNYGNLTINNSYFYNNTRVADTSACIENNGNLTVMNTEFYNVSSQRGSAISDSNSRSRIINITNCTFNHCLSTSGLGGAGYFVKSNVFIQNSRFINCSANYGGSIYSYDSNITINNSIFRNNYALMGGAIIAFNGSGDGSQFIEEPAKISINNSTFIDNNALYEGGVICDVYSDLTINSSNFTNNYARNGGVIYADYIVLNINESNFRNNNVSNFGGAIYANMNSISMNNNTFNSNLAAYANDLYSVYNLTSNLNSNNWSSESNSIIVDVITTTNSPSIIVNNSNISISSLPSSYDLRDYGYVTSVKNQGSDGNCWAFATIATLESCILKATNLSYDLSEMNLKNLMALFSQSGWCISPNLGGYDNMPIAYLVGWLGPVLESNDNNTESYISSAINSLIHVNNVYGIPSRKNYTDNDLVKEAIMKYGAVYSDIIMSTYGSTSYYTGSGSTSHAICIVGWDDNYSKTNFRIEAPGDGAFIIKNSWGNKSGDNGYYYVSYYDTSILNTCDDIMGVGGFTFILDDSEAYDKLYQYDFAGLTDWYGTGNNESYTDENSLIEKYTVSYSNEFTMSGNDIVSAFGTYVYNINNQYTVNIYVNNQLNYTQNGYFTHLGYETVKLNQDIYTKTDDNVKIELIITSETEKIQVPISANNYARVMVPSGKSYINNGLYNDAVCCLKLYTKTTSTDTTMNVVITNQTTTNMSLSITITAEDTPITTGIITVTDNQKILNIINITSAQTNITCNNINSGIHNIDISYTSNNNNYKSAKTSISIDIEESPIEIIKENTIITLDDITNPRANTTITIRGKLVSQTNKAISNADILVIMDKDDYIVTTNTLGIFTLTLKTPETPGTYTIEAKYYETETYNEAYIETTFDVGKISTNILVDPVSGVIGEKITLTAHITDNNGNPITGGNLVFKLNGKTLRSDGSFNSTATPLKFSVVNGLVTYTLNADLYLRNAKNLSASYSGSSIYEANTSATTTAQIAKRRVNVTVSTVSMTRQDTNITFMAIVTDVTKNGQNTTAVNEGGYIVFKVNGVSLKDANGKIIRVKVENNIAQYTYHVPAGMASVDGKGNLRNYTVEAVYQNEIFYPDSRDITQFNVEKSDINININNVIINNSTKTITLLQGNITDYHGNKITGTNKVCIKINGKTLKDTNNNTRYFTVTNGNINLTNITTTGITSFNSITIVTGERQAYNAGQGTIEL
ncbi:C1 family peptidase [Methanosphaera sp.]